MTVFSFDCKIYLSHLIARGGASRLRLHPLNLIELELTKGSQSTRSQSNRFGIFYSNEKSSSRQRSEYEIHINSERAVQHSRHRVETQCYGFLLCNRACRACCNRRNLFEESEARKTSTVYEKREVFRFRRSDDFRSYDAYLKNQRRRSGRKFCKRSFLADNEHCYRGVRAGRGGLRNKHGKTRVYA